MNQQEFIDYASNLIGTPYNKGDVKTHSLENGFNCFTWSAYLYDFYNIHVEPLEASFNDLRELRTQFVKVDTPKFLDIPCFYPIDLSVRHIGVMFDEHNFTHCSTPSNGVAIDSIRRAPWHIIIRCYYRHRLLV